MNEALKKPNPFENLGEEDADLSAFSPRPMPVRSEDADRAREKSAVKGLAKESGFNINNNEETPIRASRKAPGLKTFLKTLRLQIVDYNKFQRWCNDNGYSQQQGFNILVKHVPNK
jgi:hypothetical protein